MRKVALTFGLLSGLIVSVLMVINMSLLKGGVLDFDSGAVVGYGTMIIAFSMIFFGIKSYRDNHLRGAIRFGKAFQAGLLITLIASALYVATWEIYWRTDTDLQKSFVDQYTEHTIAKMKNEAATESEIEAARKDMLEFWKMYENTFVRVGFTFMEILPVGLVITLISAAILRRRDVLPYSPQPTTGTA